MIYGIRTFNPGQLPTRTIAPIKSPSTTIIPRTLSLGQLPLNNPPGTSTPQAIAPYEIPPGLLLLNIFHLRQLPPDSWPSWIFPTAVDPWTFPSEDFSLNNSFLNNYPKQLAPLPTHEIPLVTSDNGLFSWKIDAWIIYKWGSKKVLFTHSNLEIFKKIWKKKQQQARGCVCYFVEIFYFEEILSTDEWNLGSS